MRYRHEHSLSEMGCRYERFGDLDITTLWLANFRYLPEDTICITIILRFSDRALISFH